MSEIQRYRPVIGHDGFPTLWPDPSGKAVKFADHETAIALTARVCAEAFEAELADAKARIEELVHKEQGFDNADMEYGYGRGLAESIRALAALNQPQTEKMCRVCRNVGPPGYNCSECDGGGAATEKCPEDCDGFGQLIGDSDGPCPACSGLESDGGGAATAAGVPDGNLKIARRDQTIANLQGRIDAMEARRDRANFDEVTVNWGCLASVVGFAEDIYGREGRDQPPKTVRILRAALDDVENRRRAFTGTAARGEAPHKQCSGCEGSPSGDNDPCGVCQTESVSPIEKAADVLAEAVQLRVNSELPSYLSVALSNYLKVKESK